MSPATSVFRLTDSHEYQKRMFARVVEVVTLQNRGKNLEVSFVLQGSSAMVKSTWCLSLHCQCLDPRSRLKWQGEALEWSHRGEVCRVVFRGVGRTAAPDVGEMSSGSIFILETKEHPLAFSIRIKSYAASAKP